MNAAGQHADRDLRACIDKADTHGIIIKILNAYNISLIKVTFDPVDLIIIDPGPARFQRTPLSLFQDNCCHAALLKYPVRFLYVCHSL